MENVNILQGQPPGVVGSPYNEGSVRSRAEGEAHKAEVKQNKAVYFEGLGVGHVDHLRVRAVERVGLSLGTARSSGVRS